MTRGERDRKKADNDDDEYDDPDDDVSDIYSRFVSEQRVFVKRARARACHLVVVGRDARCNRDRRASLPPSLSRPRLRIFSLVEFPGRLRFLLRRARRGKGSRDVLIETKLVAGVRIVVVVFTHALRRRRVHRSGDRGIARTAEVSSRGGRGRSESLLRPTRLPRCIFVRRPSAVASKPGEKNPREEDDGRPAYFLHARICIFFLAPDLKGLRGGLRSSSFPECRPFAAKSAQMVFPFLPLSRRDARRVMQPRFSKLYGSHEKLSARAVSRW